MSTSIINTRKIVRMFSIVPMVIGGGVILLWIIHETLPPLFDEVLVMKLNPSIGIFLSGVAIWLSQSDSARNQLIRRICGIIILAIGAIAVIEYLFHINLGIDQLLVVDHFRTIEDLPGRMPPRAAFSLTLLGMVFLFSAQNLKTRYLNSFVFLIVGLSSLQALIGYLYTAPALYSYTPIIRMPIHGAIAFHLLALGVCLGYTRVAIMDVLVAKGSGGRISRRLIPAIAFLLLLIWWLRLEGQRAGLYSLEMGSVITIFISLNVVGALVLWGSNIVQKSEAVLEKETEIAEQGRQRLYKILNNTPAIVFIKDEKGHYIFINSQFQNLFGVTPEKFLGKTDYELFSKEYADVFRKNDEQVAREDRAIQMEEIVPLVDGNHYYLSVKFPLIDPVLGVRGICGIATDITERKKAEEALETAAQMKSSFASMVSHELRTPLTVIKGAVEMVEDGIDGPINEKQKQHLEIANRNVDRLNRLIDNILDFQKLESGQIKLNITLTNINTLINEVVEGFDQVAAAKNIQIVQNLQTTLPKVCCDKDSLIQVLTNLINNAIKFMDQGKITVTSQQKGQNVELCVADQGVGIQKDDIPKLFQAFSRIATPGHKSPGTGLGLVICQKIIEAHKGRIWVESEFGKGTQFYVSLPISQGC
ncbi:MAG: hypothetical protein COV45_04600 [Deltaproteobacteria bacterium CG11_big_fil_rev_8_21_14_0_20_47_16]|nr:MAG: hypothetical protein COV45_04600 [Deltaproteobacteria bacterium CG11_big_fil_rev_8_21_14_0_20_47_16]